MFAENSTMYQEIISLLRQTIIVNLNVLRSITSVYAKKKLPIDALLIINCRFF
jgi:hypothetical protein